MPPRAPFDYDVSVSADKAKRQRRRGMTGAVEGSTRRCEHPGCARRAEYRAPRSPEELDRYRWFCLDHVREYNARWNYFRDHEPDELQDHVDRARLWERPTWRFGDAPRGAARMQGMHPHGEGRAWERYGLRDPFDVLGENATINRADPAPQAPKRRKLPANLRRALDILGAPDTETRKELRRRYRDLVKDLHPDMNGGDRRDEARLRRVLWAWEQIKGSSAFAE